MVNTHTVDERNPAPPKNPWHVDSLVNTNKQWCLMFASVVRIGFRPSGTKRGGMIALLNP